MTTQVLSVEMGEFDLRSRRRPVILRPRLLHALDRSEAQVRTIVASAGYGKSILAEQWAEVPGRLVGWYRARTSASDVAVVARGFVQAASAVVPDAGRRLLERLAVTRDPDREAALLAEMLAVDLAEWPPDAWIIVDDYQLLQSTDDPETFVETLAARAPVRLLLVGRNRPRWVTSRDVLYGDVLEIGRAALAMTAEEIHEVLGGHDGDLAAGLLALADGWPAVVGISSAPGSAEGPPPSTVPEELYDFFAEEVFRRLDPDVQDGLACLAVLPLLDVTIGQAVLGESRAGRVIASATEVGLMRVDDVRLVLHPLVVSFLGRRDLFRHQSCEGWEDRVSHIYERRGDWDAAYAWARARADPEVISSVLAQGGQQLLAAGRLATVESWIKAAADAGVDAPGLRHIEAEIELRHGHHVTALTVLETDLRTPPDSRAVAFGIFMTAARASHVAADEQAAMATYHRALAVVSSRQERRSVLEGMLMCATSIEDMPNAQELLEELEKDVDRGASSEVVRLADRNLGFSHRSGKNAIIDALPFLELVDRVEDPFTAVSFMCLASWGMVLSSDYSRALALADNSLSRASRHRLDLTAPWILCVRGMALAGLRRFDDGMVSLAQAEELARSFSDHNAVINVHSLRVRVSVQMGDALDACAMETPSLHRALPFVHGELLASRALALAVVARFEESELLSCEALTVSGGVETRLVAAAARAVAASRSRDGSQFARCGELLTMAFGTNATDPLITAMRGCPDLVSAMLSDAGLREPVVHALHRSGDAALFNLSGRLSDILDPVMSLTSREREVYDLVCQGLSNAAIAKRLFISESTVKAHLHRMFDKLGVRSRSALAASAAIRRQAKPRHAASAAEESSNE